MGTRTKRNNRYEIKKYYLTAAHQIIAEVSHDRFLPNLQQQSASLKEPI
jgi:hypothetical protein